MNIKRRYIPVALFTLLLTGIMAASSAAALGAENPTGTKLDNSLIRANQIQQDLDKEFITLAAGWKEISNRAQTAGLTPPILKGDDVNLDIIRPALVECINAPLDAVFQCGGGTAYQNMLAWKNQAQPMVGAALDGVLIYLDQLRVDMLAAKARLGKLKARVDEARSSVEQMRSEGGAEACKIIENPLESARAKEHARKTMEQLHEQTDFLLRIVIRLEQSLVPLEKEMAELPQKLEETLNHFGDLADWQTP